MIKKGNIEDEVFLILKHKGFILWKREYWNLVIAFLIPALLMTGYFIFRHMAPFGSSSLLTVDMGQQYIDYFAYFRHVLLHNPGSLVYSFSNALGGEMVGLWAYYLLSPLNLILLFFPGTKLVAGIFLLTVVKYGLAGLSFAWLLKRTTVLKNWLVLTFSTSYALMGWMVAYQLNLMWYDAVICLPIVFYGLLQLVHHGKWKLYVTWLTITMITNYYMAYMMCLFLLITFIWVAMDQYTDRQHFIRQCIDFVRRSATSALLAAFILLPTIWSLLQSKGQYTAKGVTWNFLYFPPKMVLKFFIGVFNFNQMFSGVPNLFIGSFAVIGVILFFFNHNISRRSRLTAGIITVFYALSLCFQPLILLWQCGQFPRGYTYRYAFLICFWLFWLAVQNMTHGLKFTKVSLASVIVIVLVVAGYVGVNLKAFSALKPRNYILSILLFGVILLIMALPIKQRIKVPTIFVISTLELFLNASISLNQINYVPKNEYTEPTKELQKLVSQVQAKDSGFYRIGKSFFRSNNDAFQTSYNGGSVNSSALSKDTATFMGKLGNPDDDILVEYSNGTLVSDSLLNMKYYFQPNQINGIQSAETKLPVASNRLDLSEYKVIGHDKESTTYHNQYALSLGYIANQDILKLNPGRSNPAQFQNEWVTALTGNSAYKDLFSPQKFDQMSFSNIRPHRQLDGANLVKINKQTGATGIVSASFLPRANSVYYLTFGPKTNFKRATFLLNGTALTEKNQYRNPIMVNTSGNSTGQAVGLQIQLLKNSMKLQDFKLYRLDLTKFKSAMSQLSQQQLKVAKNTGRTITGTITSPSKGAVLNTSIPFSKGWHAKVNGRSVKTYRTMNMFMAIKLDKNMNRVKFSYWPPYLTLGLIVSLATLLGLLYEEHFRKQRDKE